MSTSASTDRRRLLAVVTGAYLLALALAVLVGGVLQAHSPLVVGLAADLVATVAVFAFSAACDNSSLYDPYWSVAPVPLCGYWILAAGKPSPRALLAFVLVALWGARLTYNCLERWQSLGQEDFRYLEIRGKTGKLYWPASLVSIHLLPTLWVFGGMLGTYAAVTGDRPLGFLDCWGALVTAGGIVVETLADQQLRAFRRARTDPSALLETGLWRWSRHPNYVGEVLFWWGLFLLGWSARPDWAWAALGPVVITLLFAFVSVPWMNRRLAGRRQDLSAKAAR